MIFNLKLFRHNILDLTKINWIFSLGLKYYIGEVFQIDTRKIYIYIVEYIFFIHFPNIQGVPEIIILRKTVITSEPQMIGQWNKEQLTQKTSTLSLHLTQALKGSLECGKNVNLRLGQYCRCTQDRMPLTWSTKVRNRINDEEFILQAMHNLL